MFAEIDKDALMALPFALNTLGESPQQNPISHPDGIPCHEIIWVRSGAGSFRFPDQSFPLSQGKGVLIRRGTPHAYEGAPFHTAWCTFSGGDSLLDYCAIPPFLVFDVPAYFDEATDDLMHLSMHNSTPLSRAAATYTYVAELLAAIRSAEESTDLRVRRFLENHYSDPLSLDDVAHFVGLDKFALCRSYRKARGIGVMEELKRIRIAKAKRFLRFSADPIEKIGRMCGFESPSYFAKRFRELTGMTPAAYRRAHNR